MFFQLTLEVLCSQTKLKTLSQSKHQLFLCLKNVLLFCSIFPFTRILTSQSHCSYSLYFSAWIRMQDVCTLCFAMLGWIHQILDTYASLLIEFVIKIPQLQSLLKFFVLQLICLVKVWWYFHRGYAKWNYTRRGCKGIGKHDQNTKQS